ncbi:MAG: F0F1 ATP synthase subunit gamma [Propionivibrio sp.]
MSDTAVSLRRKIASAGDLESVVRTMKAMAAASIGQYENAVRALDDYYRTVQLGLIACFHRDRRFAARPVRGHAARAAHADGPIGAIVFGSDQGLVGRFNETLVEFVIATLGKLPGRKTLWAAGERIQSRLEDTDFTLGKRFILPNSINAITPLVGQILIETESLRERGEVSRIYLFHNRLKTGAIYQAVCQQLLPLDEAWRQGLADTRWPTKNLPEVIDFGESTLLAFVREYLFVSLFRACAESLASENANRLAAMQRAEKNIGELLETFSRDFHRLRQSAIDEELFDVVSGFDALALP